MDAYLTKTVPAMREHMKQIRQDIDKVPEGATAAEVKQVVHRALDGLDATIQLVVDKDEDPVRVDRVNDNDGG
jgi:hypothetical protein